MGKNQDWLDNFVPWTGRDAIALVPGIVLCLLHI